MRLLKYERQRRLLNHFMLGADPEWVIDRYGERVDASALELKTASAFGADMNGRLLELRAFPSRWAVEVLAGISDTLHWAAYCIPKQGTRDKWLTGAYQHDDGLGGHVHFGRKVPLREVEAAALDVVNHALVGIRLFDDYLWKKRRSRRGNAGVAYGADGDTRPQVHGYEYRAFPSWLSSPGETYIVLVLSKLAVIDPQRVLDLAKKGHFKSLEDIRAFVAKYSHLDDDALLLDILLSKPFVVPSSDADFLPAWGLTPKRWDRPVGITLPKLFPSVIQPSATSVREMYNHLLHGTPLEERVPEITWPRTALPKGYLLPLATHNTVRQYGVGEILEGLCTHTDSQISLHPSEGHQISVSSWYWNIAPLELKNKWRKLFAQQHTPFRLSNEKTTGTTISLNVGLRIRKHSPRLITQFLTSGMFPIWKAFEVEVDTSDKWHQEHYFKYKNVRLQSGGHS